MEKFGPDVFEPLFLDFMFDVKLIQNDRIDLYKAWSEYELCHSDRSIKKKLQEVAKYALKKALNSDAIITEKDFNGWLLFWRFINLNIVLFWFEVNLNACSKLV